MMIRSQGLWAARVAGMVVLSSLASCAPVDDADPTESAADEVRAASSQYVKLRHDTRRCVSPLCGGYWVSRVNQPTTRCADGTWQRECYVADADWTALGLDEATLDRFVGRVASGNAIVRARLDAVAFGTFGNLGRLIALEGFDAATDAAPTGTFLLAHGPTRVCVRAPCFSWDADKLNGVTTTQVSDVRFSAVAGLSGAALDAARAQLASPEGVIVAGRFETYALGGATTLGRALVPSQVYARVSPGVSDARFCNTSDECTMAFRGRDVTSRDGCYCALCPTTVLNTTTAALYESHYNRYCSAFRATCPVARCVAPPAVGCVNHACSIVPRS
ncbi:MAG: DUF6748 domain-containing protein [Polyangiales bacterium]